MAAPQETTKTTEHTHRSMTASNQARLHGKLGQCARGYTSNLDTQVAGNMDGAAATSSNESC